MTKGRKNLLPDRLCEQPRCHTLVTGTGAGALVHVILLAFFSWKILLLILDGCPLPLYSEVARCAHANELCCAGDLHAVGSAVSS